MFESIGLRPGIAQATAAGVAEAGGGLGVLLGYQTPLASAALIGTMATAIHRVHLKNGIWVTNQGYEYNLVLIAAAAVLAESGPGKVSLDGLRGAEKSGAKWGALALALGLGGAAAAHYATETFFPASEPAAPAPVAEAEQPPATSLPSSNGSEAGEILPEPEEPGLDVLAPDSEPESPAS
jgi:putative oxidoreductase